MRKPKTMTREQLNSVCDLLNLDGDQVRTDYNGRGMNGAGCVGFVVDRGEIVALGAAIAYVLALDAGDEDYEDALDSALDLTKGAVIDGMGRQTIVYFPGLTATD